MNNIYIARALTCQFINNCKKGNGIDTDAAIAFASKQFTFLAASPDVRMMLEQGTWRNIDVDASDPEDWRMKLYAEAFVRLHAGVDPEQIDVALDDEKIGEAIGHFQDIVRQEFWSGDYVEDHLDTHH